MSAFRLIAAVSIGNALTWFDFAIFGFFAAVLAKVFFPASSDSTSLLLTFATFGVAFFARPLGAIAIGSYADRRGRKPALVLTITLMMVGTGIIGLLPSYNTIGIAASLIVVMARLIQGFAAGGEFGSATAYLSEQHPHRRGFFASWQFASQGLTSILATIFGFALSSLLTPAQLESWGWRVPFLFGLLIGPVAFYIRRMLGETPEFAAAATGHAPIRGIMFNAKSRILIATGVVVFGTVATYTTVFLPTYAVRHLGLSASNGFLAGLVAATLLTLSIPAFGALSDRIGRIPIAMFSVLLGSALAYPLFAWLTNGPTLFKLVSVAVTIAMLTASYAGALPALLAELFHTNVRTTGLAISYSLAVAVFGGFAPLISEMLITLSANISAPSFYLVFSAVISLIALVAAYRSGIR